MRKFIILALVFLFVGCAVVNVYVTFPEEKIKKAAEDILAPPEKSGQTGSFRFNFTKNLYAEEVVVKKELKTDSSAIKEAKEKINSWRGELNEYKKEGYVGETNNFKVVIKKLPDGLKKARRVRELVRKENQQREIIIKELMRINKASPKEEKVFRKIFAQTAQKYSPSGTWIQDENGRWNRK